MMKKIFYLLLLLISVQSFAQPVRKIGFTQYFTNNQYNRVWSDSMSNIAVRDTVMAAIGVGETRYRVVDSSIYIWTGSQWIKSGGAVSSVFGRTGVVTAQSSDYSSFYQSTLVSGTNIKTINGNSILGSGNLTIGASSLITKASGTGIHILYDLADDTLRHKTITADPFVKITVANDSTIHIGLDTASTAFHNFIAHYGNDGSGSGSGMVYGGHYPPTAAISWIDTVYQRMAYLGTDNFIRWIGITDSLNNTTYDTDAQLYFDALATVGTTLTPTQKGYLNTFYTGLKTDGLWSLAYDMGLPIWGSATPSGVMMKLTHTTTWVNSPTFGSTGVTGNGTSSYGNLNFSPATAYGSQDNASLAVYIQNDVVDVNQTDIGTVSTSPTRIIRINSRVGSATQVYLNGSVSSAATTATSAGFTFINRTSSSNIAHYKNGVFVANDTNTSTSLAANNIYILASNQDGSPGVFSTRTMSFWWIGATLTGTQAANLSTRVNALMTSLGINVY